MGLSPQVCPQGFDTERVPHWRPFDLVRFTTEGVQHTDLHRHVPARGSTHTKNKKAHEGGLRELMSSNMRLR